MIRDGGRLFKSFFRFPYVCYTSADVLFWDFAVRQRFLKSNHILRVLFWTEGN
jgi:hypothetical protein